MLGFACLDLGLRIGHLWANAIWQQCYCSDVHKLQWLCYRTRVSCQLVQAWYELRLHLVGLNSCCYRLYVATTKMATSVVVTCRVTVHDCRVYAVFVRLQRFTPSEEFFTKDLLVCIYCCLGCTYRYMSNRLLFLSFGSKTDLVIAVSFEACSV